MGTMMDETCREFAAALASKQSVPGGGGAAAYAGALGMALAEMVGNFTVGKKKYAAVEEDMQHMLAEGARIRERLLALVQEDADAFEPLSRAYGISKEDPARAEELERCTKDALQPPLQMMREVCRAIQLLEEMNEKGSRMLISDVGCGAALCRAALQAAALNVHVNMKELTDRACAREVDAECDRMLSVYVPRADAVFASVAEAVRG